MTTRIYREFDPYGNATVAAILFFAAVVVLHTLYALFAEVRDRELRREILRERRWRILEQLEVTPESRQSLVNLLMDDDGEFPVDWELQREKRKRHEYLAD